MKRYRCTTVLLTMACALLMVQGCVSDIDGDSETRYERPDGSRAVISDEDLNRLAEGGFEVNEGTTPPDIAGDYYLDALAISYDDDETWVGRPINNYTYNFASSSGVNEVSVSYENDSQQDVGQGLGAFISGQGQCFTLYMDGSGNNGSCDYQMAQLISGCVSEEGIADYQMGVVMIDRPADCDSLIANGHRRVIDEGDAMATRQ